MGKQRLTSVEVCAGAGGQALGLEKAGFEHTALIEMDPHACETLRLNRPTWKVIEEDIHLIDGRQFQGIDLLAGGVPCPPFSVAGKQLGAEDGRDLFPEVLRLVAECVPKAVMVENVRGLLEPVFDGYRRRITNRLTRLGYVVTGWRLLNASDFGVPQLRPRSVLVAILPKYAQHFEWPEALSESPLTVGEALHAEMSSRGWRRADSWRLVANTIAPTLVGGSRLHGGPDLGPTRARKAWAKLGVEGRTIAEEPPEANFDGTPRLTVRMCATLQGFPLDWQFAGRKTQSYRQVGNAFPAPVALAVGGSIASALRGRTVDRAFRG